MEWSEPITKAYCERTDPGFWGEPLNAITSLIVILASLAAMAYVLRRGNVSGGTLAFTGLAVAIGMGSFLLHTFATRWAELTDVLPIWAFVSLYGSTMLYRALPKRAGLPVAIPAGIFVFAAGIALSINESHMVNDTVSGSTQYLPAILLTIPVLRVLWSREHPSLKLVGGAAAVLVLSFTFRSLDLPLCDVIPVGTHFLWHLSNCVAFGLLLAALLRFESGRPGDAERGI